MYDSGFTVMWNNVSQLGDVQTTNIPQILVTVTYKEARVVIESIALPLLCSVLVVFVSLSVLYLPCVIVEISRKLNMHESIFVLKMWHDMKNVTRAMQLWLEQFQSHASR
jgi:hypothetical protein